MGELVPIASGLVAGLLLGWTAAGRRPWVWLAVAVGLGLLATVVTGEWRVSWAFVLFDIPLVALSAASGFLLARKGSLGSLRSRAGVRTDNTESP